MHIPMDKQMHGWMHLLGYKHQRSEDRGKTSTAAMNSSNVQLVRCISSYSGYADYQNRISYRGLLGIPHS